MSTMDSLIVVTAKYALFLSIAVTAFVWLRMPRPQKWELIIWAVLGGAAAVALVKLGGALYFDPRPFVTHHVAPLFPHAADNGFPSDHTVAGMLMAVGVMLYSRKWGVVLVGATLLLGIARVAAHVHSPIDILGGIAFGAAAALITLPAARWLSRRQAGAAARSRSAEGEDA